MSRGISISYRNGVGGEDRSVAVPNPYDVLGGERSSRMFWSIPRLKEIGIARLSRLGVSGPVIFFGWEDMTELRREIRLLDDNLASIEFDRTTKAAWLSHLIFCYHLLMETAPVESIPMFSIG